MSTLMIRAFVRNEDGQAFAETVIFLPFLLVALTAMIFFARLGVLSERTETAVRYGDMVSFRNGQAYSTAAIGYLLNQAVQGNSSQQLADLCLAAPNSTTTPNPNAGVNGDIRAALYQQQVVNTNSSGTPPPAPPAFFKADGITQPRCTAGTVDLNGKGQAAQPTAGQYTAGNLPVSVDGFSITASVGVNNAAAPIFAGNGCSIASGQTCSSTTGSMAFVNVAAPTQLISCVAGLNVVLQIMDPALPNSSLPTCSN